MPLKNFFHWAATDKTRAGLDYVLAGGVFDANDARDLLDQIRRESDTHLISRLGEGFVNRYFPTSRHGRGWGAGYPNGVVDHYTAGPSCASTLRWFSNMPRPPQYGESSAHVVVDVDGTIIVVVDPLRYVAWHARGANYSHVGIEHVNCGELLLRPGNKYQYMGRYNYHVNPYRPPEYANKSWWEPYSMAQVVSNIALKRLLKMTLEGMERGELTDHQAIEPKRKIDTGPLWPLEAINDLAWSGRNVRAVVDPLGDWLVREDREAFEDRVSDGIVGRF